MREVELRKRDLRFAQRIRRFRSDPVKYVNDRQLAEIVRISREAARDLNIKNDRLVARFVMINALIAPKFYEREDFQHHFRNASGDADIKIGDVFRLIRLTMFAQGRGQEVWWS